MRLQGDDGERDGGDAVQVSPDDPHAEEKHLPEIGCQQGYRVDVVDDLREVADGVRLGRDTQARHRVVNGIADVGVAGELQVIGHAAVRKKKQD